MKVRFTPAARLELLDAVAYIRRDKPGAASRFQRNAHSKLKRLVTFPESGRQIPEFIDLPYREVLVHPYRFFYRVQGDVVWIVAVWHDAQLVEEPPEP